jgi:ribose transport system substrate-binding protein
MKQFSDEERLQNAANSMADPISRRVFLKLAAVAGASIAVPTTAASAAVSSRRRANVLTALNIQTGVLAEQIHTLANDTFVAWDKGFKQVTKALNCKYRIFLHEGDATKQLAQIESYAASGGKMLIGNVAQEGVLPAVARACQKNQIYYANMWDLPPWFTPLDVGNYYVMWHNVPTVKQGYETAKALFKAIGGEGQVVWIRGILGASGDTYRTRGLMRAAKEFPGIKLVGGQPGNWNRVDSRKVMLNMVSAYPQMKAAYAFNDSQAVGVLSVLDERGMKDVKVIGMDGNPEFVQRIAEGGSAVATHLTAPGYLSAFNAVNVFDALNGWKPSVPERMLYSDSLLITQENAERAYNLLYKTSELPFDWKKMSRTLNPKAWDPQNLITPIDPWEYWGGSPQRKQKLNAAYRRAKAQGEFARVTRLYKSRFKSGPYKKLTG